MGEILLFSMIFCHIIDDFCLQPICLSKLKQKSWWEKNAPDKMYESDWMVALFEHTFSWTFSIHIPLIVYTLMSESIDIDKFECWLSASFLLNLIIHTVVDDLKANQHKINLVQDQTIHFFQIAITWFAFGAGFLI